MKDAQFSSKAYGTHDYKVCLRTCLKRCLLDHLTLPCSDSEPS